MIAGLRRSRVLLPVIVMVVALAAALLRAHQRQPTFDAFDYLSVAHSVETYGVLGEPGFPDAEPAPSMIMPPLYPLLVAGALTLDSDFHAYTACRFQHPANEFQSCKPADRLIVAIQSVLAAMAVVFVYLTARLITGRASIGVLAAALSINGYIQWSDLILTEALYLPLATAALYCMVVGSKSGKHRWFVAAGGLMALAALARPSFFYLGIVTLALVGLGWRWGGAVARRQNMARALAAYLVPFALVCSPWIARNAIEFGKPAFTASYQNLALTARLTYDQMTPREWLTGFLYWLPNGGNIATPIMGRESWRRLDLGDPSGFYESIAAFRSKFAAESGANYVEGDRKSGDMTRWLIETQVIDGLPWHLAVSTVLAWRGAMIEKWGGVAGLLAMIYGLVAMRPTEERRLFWVVSGLPVLNLGFNAFFTLDITRYNYILLVPYATALAWALSCLLGRLRVTRSLMERLDGV